MARRVWEVRVRHQARLVRLVHDGAGDAKRLRRFLPQQVPCSASGVWTKHHLTQLRAEDDVIEQPPAHHRRNRLSQGERNRLPLA